jgi:hypothetical protein
MSKKSDQSLLNTIPEKVKIIDKYLYHPNNLYTGQIIKKFIKEYIFGPIKDFKNYNITAGRWSAYGHYLLKSSYNNILNKHNIGQYSNVLVNPLLPQELIEETSSKGALIYSQDIEKDTLQWKTSKFRFLLANFNRQGVNLDLIVFYCINGLSEEIQEQVQIANDKYNIPCLIIFPNRFLSIQCYKLLAQIRLGSVILFAGESFWDRHLDIVLKNIRLNSPTYYLSWFFESRASATLEYHLKDSHDIYSHLLEAYSYLIKIKSQGADWNQLFQNLLTQVFDKEKINPRDLIKYKFKDNNEAENILKRQYTLSLKMALPDLAFELELTDPQVTVKQDINDVSDKDIEMQDNAKMLHQYFSNIFHSRPSGTMEIPTFFKNRSYCQYFLYSLEGYYLASISSFNKDKIKLGIPIAKMFQNSPDLPNTNFIAKYIILFNLI